MRSMRRYTKQILVLVYLAAVIVALRLAHSGGYLTLENLTGHRAALQEIVANHYLVSVLLYIAIYVSACLVLPGAIVLTLAGGILFHTFPGALYVIIGATSGGTLGFLLSRYAFGAPLQTRYGPQLSQFNRELETNGYLYLLAARLIPVFPFFVVNFLCGLTKLPLRTFVWTTAVGIIPASVVYAFAGSQASSISSLGDFTSPRMLFAFLFLAFLVISRVVWKKWGQKCIRG